MFPSDLSLEVALAGVQWGFEQWGPALNALIGATLVGVIIATLLRSDDE